MKKHACFIFFLLALAGCNKDDDGMKDPGAVSGIVLVDGTRNGALLKMVSNVMNPSVCVSLFDQLSETDSLAVVSSKEICIVLDGGMLDDPSVGSTLKTMWDRLFSFHAHKLLLVYDGRQVSAEMTAKVTGFYAGSDYYVRSFGHGVYCQVVDQASMDDALLSKTIDEVREKRAQGAISAGTNEGVVSQYSFVRPLRFNYYRASVEYDENGGDTFYTGKNVEKVTEAQRSQSVYADFMVRYTIFSAKGYGDRYLLAEMDGAGFTTNILRRVDSYYTSNVYAYWDVAQSKNLVRCYDIRLTVLGKSKIPEIIQALPSSEIGSKTVSESKSASLGFKVNHEGPVLSGALEITNSVAYDQPSFSTRPFYDTDASKHSFRQNWETSPVTGYKGAKNILLSTSSKELDITKLIFGYHHYKSEYSVNQWVFQKYDLNNPVDFPIPFYSFSPQVSLLAYTDEDEISVEACAEIHLQDDKQVPYHGDIQRNLPYHDVKDRVKITFSGENVIWE